MQINKESHLKEKKLFLIQNQFHSQSREWFEEEAKRWQKDLNPAEETRESLEQRLADINVVLTQAQVE